MTFITHAEGVRRSIEFLNGERAEQATRLQVLVAARQVTAELDREQRERKWLREVFERLLELCPCDPNPSTTDGPQQECPVHGDGETFVAEVRGLRGVLQRAEEIASMRPVTPYEAAQVAAAIHIRGVGGRS